MLSAMEPARQRAYFASDGEIIIVHSICNLPTAHKNTHQRQSHWKVAAIKIE